MFDKIPLLKSRKFQLVITSVAGIISSVFAGAVAPDAALYSIVVLVLGLVVSIAIEDASKRGAIFDKAQELVDQAEWLTSEVGDLLTVVEEKTGEIESEKE